MNEHPSDGADGADGADEAGEFLRRFEAAEVGQRDFRHRDHIRMAWLYTTEYGRERAEARATAGIRHLAERHGVPHKYHETLTRAWVRAVAHFVAADRDVKDFDDFLRRHPALLRRDLLLTHYTAGLLWSDEARMRWVEPDVAPIPA
jgi:hypothetical protein